MNIGVDQVTLIYLKMVVVLEHLVVVLKHREEI
jgi:hypothetical protein